MRKASILLDFKSPNKFKDRGAEIEKIEMLYNMITKTGKFSDYLLAELIMKKILRTGRLNEFEEVIENYNGVL
ncbi:MAG: hypothetical protein QXS91_01810 [Candidatus Anstonellales archaeon]